MTDTPTITSECGKGYTTHLVCRAIAEHNELCPCGRTKKTEEHYLWCPDAIAIRFDELRTKIQRINSRQYITMEAK